MPDTEYTPQHDFSALDPEGADVIAECILSATGVAILAGDFDGFARHCDFPLELETFDGSETLRNADALRVRFQAVHKYYANQGVEDLHRSCLSAEFDADQNLHSTHVSHMLVAGTIDHQSVYGYTRFRNVRGAWRIFAMQYAVSAEDAMSKALSQQAAPDDPELTPPDTCAAACAAPRLDHQKDD